MAPAAKSAGRRCRRPLVGDVLTFSGQLVRIAAIYDRDRTQGLTDADLRELVSAVYGLALLPSRATTTNALVERRIIGSWGDHDTLVALWADAYPRRLGLDDQRPRRRRAPGRSGRDQRGP